MKLLAGVALLLAIGAGLGTYFALGARGGNDSSNRTQAHRFANSHTPEARIMLIPSAGP
jgi:hypothetical protein